MWVYSPPKPKVPVWLKAEISARAAEIIETRLKPDNIKPPPKDARFNYLVDIFTKWRRNFFYFCGTYHCPGPKALTPSFEIRFARMEYTGDEKFNLAYMRHTGQWWEILTDLSLDECLQAVVEGGHFMP